MTNEAADIILEQEIRFLREEKARQAEREAEQEKTRAAQALAFERFQANRDAVSAAERAGRASGDFRRGPIAPPPGRRVAMLLRQRLGSEFPAIIADIKACGWESFKHEVARVIDDENAEKISRKREGQAHEMA